MPWIPVGMLEPKAVEERDCTVQSLSAEMQTRTKKGTKTNEEEYRWIIRCTLYTERKDINYLNLIVDQVVQAPLNAHALTSNWKGGTDIDITLDYNDFPPWRCISDNVSGIAAEGSQFASETQQWMSLSQWADAPWNTYWTP